MFYLLLAIFSSALISLAMRASEKYVSNDLGVTATNYVVCSLLAVFYTGPAQVLPRGDGAGIALWMGVVSGVMYLVSLLLLQWNVSRNGVVLSTTFMKLGVLVPTTLSLLFFQERLGIGQIIGYLCALAAILLIHFDGGGEKAEKRGALLLLLLIGGTTDAMSKIYERLGEGEWKDQYLFYTFLTALILCVGLILMKRQRIGRSELFFGTLVGVPNYFCSRFLLMSLDSVPAVVAYPTYSVATLAVVSCAGLLIFREKLSQRRCLAVGIIMAALVLLNL